VTAATAPATTLARVQGCWSAVAGDAVAREAEPVADRDGEILVRCASAVWASELELLAPQLVEGLNAALGAPPRASAEGAGGRPRRQALSDLPESGFAPPRAGTVTVGDPAPVSLSFCCDLRVFCDSLERPGKGLTC